VREEGYLRNSFENCSQDIQKVTKFSPNFIAQKYGGRKGIFEILSKTLRETFESHEVFARFYGKKIFDNREPWERKGIYEMLSKILGKNIQSHEVFARFMAQKYLTKSKFVS
jgi:hypothetical protein